MILDFLILTVFYPIESKRFPALVFGREVFKLLIYFKNTGILESIFVMIPIIDIVDFVHLVTLYTLTLSLSFVNGHQSHDCLYSICPIFYSHLTQYASAMHGLIFAFLFTTQFSHFLLNAMECSKFGKNIHDLLLIHSFG